MLALRRPCQQYALAFVRRVSFSFTQPPPSCEAVASVDACSEEACFYAAAHVLWALACTAYNVRRRVAVHAHPLPRLLTP